jgi:hypothetical protein
MKLKYYALQKEGRLRLVKTFLPGLLIILMSQGCETVIEIELPVEKPRLVVNSVFNADSLLTVNVTKSRASSEPGHDFEKVENASVEVFKNKKSLGYLIYAGKGNYRSTSTFLNEPNAEYSLKVQAAEFETAESNEILPAMPVISSIATIPDNQNNLSSYKKYKNRFNLQDPAESNTYFIRAWLVNQNGNKSVLKASLKNELGQFSPLRSESLEINVFNDESFNGKELTIELDYQAYIGYGDKGNYSILVEVAGIPKSYFDYLYSVARQFEDIPLLEPKNLPLANNIKNGLGIFAPYNVASFSFDVAQ